MKSKYPNQADDLDKNYGVIYRYHINKWKDAKVSVAISRLENGRYRTYVVIDTKIRPNYVVNKTLRAALSYAEGMIDDLIK